MSNSNDKGGRAAPVRPSANPDAARALATNIAGRLLACSFDELRVLDQLLARIEKGRDTYGPLDLARARDWDRELAEEFLDVQVYRAIGKVLASIREADRIERGLVELRDAEAVTAPRPLVEFEMVDERFDDGGEG